MLSHVIVGVRDFERALAFYRALMPVLGLQERFCDRGRPWAGWQPASASRPLFLIGTPYDGQLHEAGNGQMTAFLAATREVVDRAFAVAMANAAQSEGPPGLRPEYHASYYGAYFRDTEGNKLCVACHSVMTHATKEHELQVRPVEPEDAAAISDIYNHYIEHTAITFEEVPLAAGEMAARIDACTKSYPWLVCVDGGVVVGYAYASKWKERAAYRHTAEATVYVRAGNARRGCGQALYAALLPAAFERGYHVLLGCIALPNEASVALHERFGFRKVAHFTEVGRKFGQWIDVGYWQCVGGTPHVDHPSGGSADG